MRNMPKYTDNDIDEDMKLTRSDYIKILHHYQPEISLALMSKMSMNTMKKRAHHILAEKLCRCVKTRKLETKTNVQGRDEGRRIAYCTRSIFNNRGLRPHGFRCKTAKRRGSLHSRLLNDITKTRDVFSL
jgi:hypothetical protein